MTEYLLIHKSNRKVTLSMKNLALIVRGGFKGHEPVQVSEIFGNLLEDNGFTVEISETLDSLLDQENKVDWFVKTFF